MIKRDVLFSDKFKYEHLAVNVMEAQGDDVCAFSATFSNANVDGRMSPGLMEVNETLWLQDSEKRPEGFVVVRTAIKGTTTTTVLASREWFYTKLDKEGRKEFDDRLDKEVGKQS
ncbi:hypothetical protein [Bacillus sp. NEAU-Y102]